MFSRVKDEENEIPDYCTSPPILGVLGSVTLGLLSFSVSGQQ